MPLRRLRLCNRCGSGAARRRSLAEIRDAVVGTAHRTLRGRCLEHFGPGPAQERPTSRLLEQKAFQRIFHAAAAGIGAATRLPSGRKHATSKNFPVISQYHKTTCDQTTKNRATHAGVGHASCSSPFRPKRRGRRQRGPHAASPSQVKVSGERRDLDSLHEQASFSLAVPGSLGGSRAFFLRPSAQQLVAPASGVLNCRRTTRSPGRGGRRARGPSGR